MKKSIYALSFLMLFSSCVNNNSAQRDEMATVSESSNTEGDGKYLVVVFVDSIIKSDPNSLNNGMTKNETEARITKTLKEYVPLHPEIISDIPLECVEVLQDFAHFKASLQLSSNMDWRIDVGIGVSLSKDKLSTLIEGAKYYLKEPKFKEFSFDYSMKFSKDPQNGSENKKIMFWYEVDDNVIIEKYN